MRLQFSDAVGLVPVHALSGPGPDVLEVQVTVRVRIPVVPHVVLQALKGPVV